MLTRSSYFLSAVLSLPGLLALAPVVMLTTGPVAEARDEMVVTTRKREESLQDVPVSVSAFGEDDFEDRQIRDLEDVARFTPGLSSAKAFGRSTDRPVIRGQGNVLAGVQFGVESGTAFFVDGIYYPGDLSSLSTANLERIEVIKGPQSALYGRNTYAGAINFVTKSPGDELSTGVKARYGEDEDMEITADISGPLVPGLLSGGLIARYYNFDGEYDNIVTGQTVGDEETTSISGVLDFTPSENVSIRTRLSYQEDEDGTRAFFLQPSEMNNCFPGTRSNAAWAVTGSTNNNQYFCGEINRPSDTVQLNDGPAIAGQPAVVPGIPDAQFPGLPFPPFNIPPSDPYNPAQGVAFSGVERDIFLASALTEWDIGGSGWSLIGAFAYRDEERKTGSDSDHTSINFLFGDPPPNTAECTFCASEIDEYEDYSLELRLESPQDQALRWMVGAFYYDFEQDGSDITFALPEGGPVIDEETVENWAVFGMVEWDVVETVSTTLELRYFDEEKGLKENDTTFDRTASFDEIAPRLSVNWDVADDILLYGIYAKGYKPGGLNGTPGESVGAPTYEQEESDNFELGVKSTLADGRVTANAAVFFIDSSDVQLTTPLASGSGTLTSIVTNQGDGETFGLELELVWSALDNLDLGATYALADTEFTKGCDEFQWTLTSGGGLLSDATACTGNDVNGNGDGSIKGKQFPLSSEHQVSLFADYTQPLTGSMDLFAGADFTWESEKPVQVHNQAWVPPASILNARIGIGGENWSATVYGRNLTDEDAPSMVTRWLQDPLIFGLAGFPSTTAAGAPAGACPPSTCSTSLPRAFFGDMRRGRNFGVEFTYRFGG